ncbi:hypothetical protein HK105_204010 [Polyrhizophydium stewartii]|uniref:Uncharacterized protein n=1 Tax=Polyrhizophydium stewartii TaxID=2732419 RepID=A0ABR4NAP0_9FUNG
MSTLAPVTLAGDAAAKQRIAIALWNYDAQEDNELSFVAGDRIVVTEFCNEDWYEGTIGTAAGFFPANHVRVLPEASSVGVEHPKSVSSASPTKATASTASSPAATAAGASAQQHNGSPVLGAVDGSRRQNASAFSGLAVGRTLDDDNADSEPADDVENASEENLAEDSWNIVTTEDGQTYYWNSATGETSWDPPFGDTPGSSFDNLNLYDEGRPSVDAETKKEAPLARIEMVPPELIRKEGWLAYKARKEFGGVDPKRAHSWHNHWAIVCVGYLVFYKDEPSKLKKRSEKTPVVPSLVVTLDAITLNREKDPKKKPVFTLHTRSGAIWALQPQNESEVSEWMTTISEATKEASTAAEYENVMVKLFTRPAAEEPKVDPSSKKKVDDKKLPKQDSKKKERISVAESEEADISTNKTKIKSKLNAFFKRQQEKDTPASRDSDKKDDVLPDGLTSQGIYRLSGNAATIQRIKLQINQNNFAELDDEALDLNVVSGLLKLYFRELRDPLIPFTFYDRFIACMRLDDYNERLIEIKNLVQGLPKIHYDVLEFLMRHLVRVAAQSEINKMEPSNLAIVFGPTIVRVLSSGNDDMQAAYANMMNMSFQNALVEAIIIQTEWIFDGNPN